MSRKLTKEENCKLQDLEYGKKTYQRGKSETHMVVHEIWQETLKNVQKEKQKLQDLEYGDKPGKRKKRKLTGQDLEYDEKH